MLWFRRRSAGWGESVITAGYGSGFAVDGTNSLYTTNFGGTSSATPIVAGACAAIQGAHRYRSGGIQVIGPAEMRGILQATASAQTGPNQNIGPLPRLDTAMPLAFADRRIWVDFAYTGEIEAGTPAHPVKTLPLAITASPDHGSIIIKGSTTAWTGTITKPCTLGSATIGE